jgi:hypothetical protein
MSSMTAHRHPETLFSLLMLPVAPTWEESDSDHKEAQPPSMDRRLTSESSKPSKSSLPIKLKEPTASDVMGDTNFDDILVKITAGFVTAGAVTFQEKIIEMFLWSSPYNDYVKITDFYSTCDQTLWACAREKGKEIPTILTVVMTTKIVAFIVILLTVRNEARKNSLSLSTKEFMSTFMKFAACITKLLKNRTFQSIAYAIGIKSFQFIQENPQTSVGIHTASFISRKEFYTFLNSANLGYLNVILHYAEVKYTDSLKSALRSKSVESGYELFRRLFPGFLTSTGVAVICPSLAVAFPVVGMLTNTAIAWGIVKSIGPIVEAELIFPAVASSQWPTQLELGDLDELTLESPEVDTGHMQFFSDESFLQVVQFILGEDVDEYEANREEVFIRP